LTHPLRRLHLLPISSRLGGARVPHQHPVQRCPRRACRR
jgi:hypothetical protein